MVLQDWNCDGETYTTLEQMPEKAIGFVYLITVIDYSTNVKYKYIGKKNLFSTRKRNFGKKEAALVTDKRKKLYEMVTKESDWKSYYSSNKAIKDIVKNQDCKFISREILQFAFTKKHLTYLEIKHMFDRDVLEHPAYLNDNILGKFFDKDADSWLRIELDLPF